MNKIKVKIDTIYFSCFSIIFSVNKCGYANKNTLNLN